MMSDPQQTCEDCKLPSDLGNKCRKCYRLWSQRLWADIPREMAKLQAVSKRLNAMPQGQRKATAEHGMSRNGSGELYQLVIQVLDGPYGPQLLSCLQAITNAPTEGSKSRRRTNDEEAE